MNLFSMDARRGSPSPFLLNRYYNDHIPGTLRGRTEIWSLYRQKRGKEHTEQNKPYLGIQSNRLKKTKKSEPFKKLSQESIRTSIGKAMMIFCRKKTVPLIIN